MTNDEFKIWLLGYILLSGDKPVNAHQIDIIKNHANLALEVDGFLTPENQTLIDNIQPGQQLGQYVSM